MELLKRHALSIAAVAILILWVVLYVFADPKTHLGSFYGNAIADWSGSVAVILLTKFLYEQGSSESKHPPSEPRGRRFLVDHSLSIVLVVTGIAWALLYARSDPSSKWGQVVGNIVSEWLQMLGLVLLTKRFVELGSKESR